MLDAVAHPTLHGRHASFGHRRRHFVELGHDVAIGRLHMPFPVQGLPQQHLPPIGLPHPAQGRGVEIHPLRYWPYLRRHAALTRVGRWCCFACIRCGDCTVTTRGRDGWHPAYS